MVNGFMAHALDSWRRDASGLCDGVGVVPSAVRHDDLVGGRQEINVLLTRCRQDLVAAGIAPTKLLERAPGGRATRIALAPGAEIKHAGEYPTGSPSTQ